jgi:predicted unusual protein kinase regulating ubiquinone biosynthesis (AarF/ABC1/UbiB family)
MEQQLEDGARLVAVATDGSESANRAVAWAAAHATAGGAGLVAIRVLNPSTIEDFDVAHVEETRVSLEIEVRRLVANGRAVVVPDDAEDIALTIVNAAEAAGAHELVVGNSGMRGRTEFLLGNVANRVTHLAGCTVIVVNTGFGDADPQERQGASEPDGSRTAELRDRAADIARILGPVVLRSFSSSVFSSDDDPEGPRRLREALEQLGPAFGKIGQLLSTRPDLIPAPYLEELSSLQSAVPPMTEAEVVSVMEQELGVPWEDVFESIDPEPLAAGTIGQVHRARLTSGHRVVVKVQRPTAAELVEQDLTLLEGIVRQMARVDRLRKVIDIESVVGQLGDALRAELDYREEADNLERMADALKRYSRLATPACHRQLSSARLLVMDEIDGVPVLSAPPSPERTEAASQLLQAYYQQVLEDGFFHADPHPGNLLWADGKVWLLDLGMVGVVDAHARRQLMLLFLAFAQHDAHLLAEVSLDMAESDVSMLDREAYEADLHAIVESLEGLSVEELQLADLFNDLIEIAVRHGVPLPVSMTMIGKALGQAQLTVAALAPELDPIAEARSFFGASVTRRLVERIDPQELIYQAEKWRYRLDQIGDGLTAFSRMGTANGPEIHFTSTRLDKTVTRAGRTVALGLTAGLVWIAAGVASSSNHPDVRLAKGLRLLAGGLSAGLISQVMRKSGQ